MSVSVEVPELGESVTEAIIAVWNKEPGEYIEQDEILVELETDKVAVEVPAPTSGTIKELKAEIDDTVNVGDLIAIIEPGDEPAQDDQADDGGEEASEDESSESDTSSAKTDMSNEERGGGYGGGEEEGPGASDSTALSPAVRRLVEEHDLDPSDIEGTGPNGRILKGDVLAYVEEGKGKKSSKKDESKAKAPERSSEQTEQRTERVRMSRLRQTIANRLVEAQQNAAILTTFNEVDMTNLMAMRKRYQDRFVDRYDTKVGFMSFFVKAAIEALKEYPEVNAEIDGKEIVYKNYYDIGIAVGGPKGLVVPVIRDADQMSFAEIELEIQRLAKRARDNKLTIDELQGGTFTISNGGIYGSMLSTPILNPPQSGILGMHNIVDRPVAIDGEVKIRPIMYLALSYDHRIIDGKGAVSFLVRLKECIENPERILLEV